MRWDCWLHGRQEIGYSTKFIDYPKRTGLRPIRFHDLRHSCSSLLLANGVPMKQIQEWLGHSDFSTTANIYQQKCQLHSHEQLPLAGQEAVPEGQGAAVLYALPAG